MKIVLMSDSHGRSQNIDKVLQLHPDADYYLHCGDIECDEYTYPNLIVVRGNNDYFGDFPEKRILVIGNHRILMMHSHTVYSFQRTLKMAEMAKAKGCDMVFFGHTHIAFDQVVDGVRLINPGSLFYSRDGKEISYCVITIQDDIQVDFHFAPFI